MARRRVVAPPAAAKVRLFLSPGGLRRVRTRIEVGRRADLDALVAAGDLTIVTSTD